MIEYHGSTDNIENPDGGTLKKILRFGIKDPNNDTLNPPNE